MASQKPIAKFRAGPVSAALWENEISMKGGTVTVLKCTVERRYRDSNDNWKSSNSFSRNEVPLAVWCLSKAFEAMIVSAQGQDGADEEVVG